MEYAQDLTQNKKTVLRECHLQALFAQLFVSLYYLHEKGLVHRDIKIENVMVTPSGSIEFIDFVRGHSLSLFLFSTFLHPSNSMCCGVSNRATPSTLAKT